MPTATFLNLPEEKQQKLLSAAWAEFTRVPYEQVSINKIIQAAAIPRGSFYMYFQDKEALFYYLLSGCCRQFISLFCQDLDALDGDLFAAMILLYRRFSSHEPDDGPGEDIRRLLSILRKNPSMHPGLVFRTAQDEDWLGTLRQHIDTRRLDLRCQDDLSGMIYLLVAVTISSLPGIGYPSRPDSGDAECRFLRYISMLSRGLSAPEFTLSDPEEIL